MNRDKKVLSTLLSRTLSSKSSIVTGMPGIGVESLYHDFIHQIDFKKLPYLFLTYEITNVSSYKEFFKEAQELNHSLFVVVQYTWDKNFPEFLEEMGKHLNKNPHEFMFVVFAENIFPRIMLYENVLLPLKPLNLDDSEKFLDEICIRYHKKLDQKQKKQIIELSGGNCALLTQLALDTQANDILETIYNSLGETSQFLFGNNKTFQNFFQTFGIKSHNLVFSPLFEDYAKKQPVVNKKQLERLPKLDQKLLIRLEKNRGKLVTQKELSELTHSNSVTVSKLITNLQDKFPFLEIEVVKGKGFILIF